MVNVFKGESGALLAKLPEYDVFTEADNLSHLFLQVNDLIYTYFDIPKKYQDGIRFSPPKEAIEYLIKISNSTADRPKKITVQSFYAPYIIEKLRENHFV